MRRDDVPGRDAYFGRWSDLHLGYDPHGAFWPRTWLTFTYYCARPLARLEVAPNVVTAAGGLVSGLVPVLAWLGGGWLLLGAILVVASGLLDTLDGAVAVLTGRVTAWGHVLDSIVDRLSDGCYLLALWLLGAPAWLCLAGGAATILQEYLRALASDADGRTVSVVTVAERPTRIIVTTFALCGAFAVPTHADRAVVVGAAAWLGLGTLGFVQLARGVHRSGAERG